MGKLKAILLAALVVPVVLRAQVNCDELTAQFRELPDEKTFLPLIEKLSSLKYYDQAARLAHEHLQYHPGHETSKYIYLRDRYRDLAKKENAVCPCKFTETNTWISSNGPSGADATAFYQDEKGNYWLGTGSSGGVYYSADQGKTWTARNKGIGPWHITYIGKQKDSLLIKVSDELFHRDGRHRYYTWDEAFQGWKLVPTKDQKYRYQDEIGYAKVMTDRFRAQAKKDSAGSAQFPLNLSHPPNSTYDHFDYEYPKWGVYPYNSRAYSNDYPTNDHHYFGFQENTPALAKLNRTVPRDVFKQSAGNVFPLKEGNHILLSRSGPFLIKGGKKISQLSKSGLHATDVRQLINTPSGMYALVNQADIWLYANGNWMEVFNAYERHIKMKDPISPLGYDTKSLIRQHDGSVLFIFCGSVWKLSGKKATLEVKTVPLPDSLDNGKGVFVPTHAAYDKNGDLYVLGSHLFYMDENEKYNEREGTSTIIDDSHLLRRKAGGAGFTKVKTGKYEWADLLFVDRKGHVWTRGYQGVTPIGIDAGKRSAHKPGYDEDGLKLSGIAFNKNGNFSFLDNNGISTWNYETMKWEQQKLQGFGYSYTVNALCYDEKGNVYAGTGKDYQEGCGGISMGNDNMGLFKLDGKKWVPVLDGPNPWIFCVVPNEKYGLAIGTSGSGVQFLKTK